VAVGVGGAAGQLVVAGRRVPIERPATPGPLADRLLAPRVGPCAVDADLDSSDRRGAAPGPAAERDPTRIDESTAREEVGDAGRAHQRPNPDVADRDARIIGIGLEPVGAGLLVAFERLGDGLDPAQPLDAPPAVSPR